MQMTEKSRFFTKSALFIWDEKPLRS